jgi:hypothetical protein
VRRDEAAAEEDLNIAEEVWVALRLIFFCDLKKSQV